MKKKARIIFVIAGVLVVLSIVLYNCGGGGGGGYGGGGTPPTPSTVQVVVCSAGTTTTVSIVNQITGFSPSSVTVPVNSIVQWTNNDSIIHTVTSTTVPTNGTFDSGNLAPGASICLKFTSAGTFNYHCSIHPTMTGLVTVQ